MLLEKLSRDFDNYAHVTNIVNGDHTILINDEDMFLVHSEISDIYCAECNDDKLISIEKAISEISPDLLETTNISLYQTMRSRYSTSYQCNQYTFRPFCAESHDLTFRLISENDLPYVIKTYYNPPYIRQLFNRGHILGAYLNDSLAGYIACHIDGTLGALYIDPLYRSKGYAKALIRAALDYYNDPLFYSQVLTDNLASINLHKAINAHKSNATICWMYNEDFSFK